LFDAGDGNDTVTGGDLDDRMSGGNGADILIGGAGNDLFLMGLDSDTDVVVATPGGGADTIGMFDVALDKIDVSLFNFGDFSEIQPLIAEGGNTTITLPDGSSMVLVGVNHDDLTAANFIL
jgi:Ca2+-binding RTX toxin-like protein